MAWNPGAEATETNKEVEEVLVVSRFGEVMKNVISMLNMLQLSPTIGKFQCVAN